MARSKEQATEAIAEQLSIAKEAMKRAEVIATESGVQFSAPPLPHGYFTPKGHPEYDEDYDDYQGWSQYGWDASYC